MEGTLQDTSGDRPSTTAAVQHPTFTLTVPCPDTPRTR
ncbi:hypothetical protein RRG08_000535, partial [Elysia crispata]